MTAGKGQQTTDSSQNAAKPKSRARGQAHRGKGTAGGTSPGPVEPSGQETNHLEHPTGSVELPPVDRGLAILMEQIRLAVTQLRAQDLAQISHTPAEPLQGRIAELERTLEKEREAAQADKERLQLLQAECSNLSTKVGSLEEKEKAHLAEIEKLNARIRELQEQAASLEKKHEEARKTDQAAEMRISAISSEREETRRLLHLRDEQIAKLEKTQHQEQELRRQGRGFGERERAIV